jgi:hypothetical protein
MKHKCYSIVSCYGTENGYRIEDFFRQFPVIIFHACDASVCSFIEYVQEFGLSSSAGNGSPNAATLRYKRMQT